MPKFEEEVVNPPPKFEEEVVSPPAANNPVKPAFEEEIVSPPKSSFDEEVISGPEPEPDYEQVHKSNIQQKQQAEIAAQQAVQVEMQKAAIDQDPQNWSSERFKKEAPKPLTIEEKAIYDATIRQKQEQEKAIAAQLLPEDVREEKPVELRGDKAAQEPQKFTGNKFMDDFIHEGVIGPAKDLMAGVYKASASTADLIDFYASKVSEKLNLPKTEVFSYMKSNWADLADQFSKDGLSEGLAKKIYQGLGRAAWDVPVKYMGPGKVLGGATLPAVGAAEGYKEGGVKGAIQGGAEGALMHGTLKGLNELPAVAKYPAAFATGAATTPGGVEDKVAGGAVMTGLSVGPSKSMNEFKDTIARGPLGSIGEKTEGIYQNYVNRMQSIENVVDRAKKLGAEIKPGEDPALRARTYLGIGQKVQSVLEDKTYKITPKGDIEITGEGFKPILNDYETQSIEKNPSVREKDLTDFLIARRTVEDLQRSKSEFNQENIATKEQVAQAETTLNTLSGKYGENMGLLENTATRVYDYQKRVLNTLVDAGNLSQDKFDQILEKNPHYVPFDRVMDTIEPEVITPKSKNRFTGARSPVKRIKGSEKEIENPLESIIKNTYRIYDAAERNTVARGVARLSNVFPDEISPVKIPIVPLAKAKLKAQIDPVLQGELRQVIKDLKGEYSRKLDVGGRRLGYYQYPKKIVTRFATREDVISHELGHYMDNLYDLQGKFLGNKEINVELRKLADMRYENQEVSPHYKKYVREGSEKIAALVDAYVTKPFILDEIAPKSKEALTWVIESNPVLQPLLKIRPSMVYDYERMTQTIFGESPFKPRGNVIEYFEEGKRKYVEVTPNLYQAMTGMNETSLGVMTKLLSYPANWLRTGATMTPEFSARNVIRDQFTALMQTKIGYKPFIDPIGAVADILGKKDVYYDWMRSGGAYAGFTELSRSNLQKKLESLKKNPKLLNKLNIISSAQDLSQLLEQSTRLGMYKAGVEKGLSPVQAGFESREGTIDFARRGAKTKEINATIAFFNAGIQGVDKSIRTAKTDPAGFTVKGIASITVPTILVHMMNRNDPDYKEIPQWQRDLFWVFKAPGTQTYVRIPKPFLYGQLFGSLPERMMNYLETNDPKSFDKFGKTLYDSITPVSGDPEGSLLATAMKPVVEYWANKSFFSGRQIVPESRTKLLPEEQYGKYTSETAKLIGSKVKHSPEKIENAVQGYAGGSGRYALEGSDFLLNSVKKARGEKIPPERPRELSDIPFVKGFVTRPPESQSESVNKFYQDKRDIDAAYQTYRKQLKEDRKEDAQKTLSGHPVLKKFKAVDGVADQIKSLDDAIDATIKSERLSDNDKRSRIKQLEKKRMFLAQRGNDLIKKQ